MSDIQNKNPAPQNNSKNEQKTKKDTIPVWAIVLLIIGIAVVFILPVIGVVAALTIPVLVAETSEVKNKTILKKTVSELNQSILMSQAVDNKDYSTFDDIWTKRIKSNLLINSDIENGIRLNDLTEIKYNKLSDNCNAAPENPTKETACAVLTIDADGFDKGQNKHTYESPRGIIIKDQFDVLLYKNIVVPAINTAEYILILYSKK